MQHRHEHFSDRLLARLETGRAPVCVGIDPDVGRLPADLRPPGENPGAEQALAAVYEFSALVLDAVADHVPAVKFQSACFERYREDGLESLYSLVDEAERRGLVVILDAKRGDIGVSAEQYAAGLFDPVPFTPSPFAEGSLLDGPDGPVPDAVTVNPLFGIGGVRPFCRDGRGAFALVRTSNPEGDVIQRARLEDGRTVSELLASLVHEWGESFLGARGWSDLGAVVGATKREELAVLRRLMPRRFWLAPGYGAQGAGPEDAAACFDAEGRGALITASRSIIYAFEREPGLGERRETWVDAVADAAVRFADEIRRIVSARAAPAS